MSIFDGFYNDGLDSKRTLGIRDRQILYRRAGKKCENPTCGKKLEFDEMQVGHKTAWSKGGRTTLASSKCLCYRCNKLQGTDNWATFLKKQGIEDPKTRIKKSLQKLNIQQLKSLATKHKVKVTGKIVENFFETFRKAPTKSQYINKLTGVVTEKEIVAVTKEVKKPVKRKRQKKSDDFWF
ncbi:HNH endonuclease [Chloroflexota bacterium]